MNSSNFGRVITAFGYMAVPELPLLNLSDWEYSSKSWEKLRTCVSVLVNESLH